MLISILDYIDPILDHIPALTGFAIGLCAIFGDTRDKNKPFWRSFTRTGFITLAALILGVFGSAGANIYSDYKKDKIERHRNEVAEMIRDDINIGINELLHPFRMIHKDTYPETYVGGEIATLDTLLEENNLINSQEVCLDIKPINIILIPDQGTWRDIFKDSITRGVSRLEQIRLMQNQNLSSELMASIRELLVNGPLIGYARDQNNSFVKKDRMIPDCFVGHAIGAHKEFLEMIKKISHASERNLLSPI